MTPSRHPKIKLPKMEEGIVYRVRYFSQAGNYRWYEKKFTATFVGYVKSVYADQAMFSLRPQAGTQVIDMDNILKIDEMSRNSADHKLPETIRAMDKDEVWSMYA